MRASTWAFTAAGKSSCVFGQCAPAAYVKEGDTTVATNFSDISWVKRKRVNFNFIL